MKLLRNEVSFGYEVIFAPYAPAYFIREAYFIATATSHAQRISQIPQGIYFIEKSTPLGCFFLEQGTGVEPASEAWEATIIADIRTLHREAL